MIKSIRKRDGRLVDFEVDKIAGALYKAFSACFDKVELKKVYAISHDMNSILLESIENESSDDINLFDVFENLMNDAMDKTRKEDLKKFFKLLKELNIDEEIIYQKVSETFSMTDETLKSVIK